MRSHQAFGRGLVLAVSLAAGAALALAAPSARGAVVAHWSFDQVNGGVYADDTGAHDATVVTNGTGAIANDSGRFGNGITSNNAAGAQATNNAYLSFANLTELMGPGAGSYSVAAWVRTTNTTANNPVLADWGNAAAGTRRFSYWFSTTNSGGNSRPRGQSRAANTPVDPANIDIFARTVPTAAGDVADGGWHHVAWTWDKDNTVLRTYVDGALADTNDVNPTNADMLIADSPIGTIGRKGDDNRYFVGSLDEIWVVEGVLSEEEVIALRDTNVIPEPAALAWVACGAAALARRRRRA